MHLIHVVPERATVWMLVVIPVNAPMESGVPTVKVYKYMCIYVKLRIRCNNRIENEMAHVDFILYATPSIVEKVLYR